MYDVELGFISVAHRSSLAFALVLTLAGASGCSSDETTVDTEVDELSSGSDMLIPFVEGEPASVYFDADRDVLYVADNLNNQVWTWSDAAGLSKHATTPDPGGQLEAEAAGVGQIIALDDGTLLVARTGKSRGGFGALAWVRPDGSTGLVPGIDENIRRLGLVEAPDGTIYGTRFEQADGPLGAVTRIDLASGESVVSDGFGKLVGIVAVGEELFVSDQSQGVIYSASLGALPARAADWTRFAELPAPDQLSVGPDGSLFTGQFGVAPDSTDTIAIRQIDAGGQVTRFIADPFVAKPSGVAYDAKQRRLFVADAGNIARYGVLVFAVP